MEVYGLLASGGIYDWPIISQISWILGQVMNGIYNVMSAIGIENIGVSIIIFTIIVYMILLPLTIKQQKFSKIKIRFHSRNRWRRQIRSMRNTV